jgi:hypothetical protein
VGATGLIHTDALGPFLQRAEHRPAQSVQLADRVAALGLQGVVIVLRAVIYQREWAAKGSGSAIAKAQKCIPSRQFRISGHSLQNRMPSDFGG